jgi:hypothetical protein
VDNGSGESKRADIQAYVDAHPGQKFETVRAKVTRGSVPAELVDGRWQLSDAAASMT